MNLQIYKAEQPFGQPTIAAIKELGTSILIDMFTTGQKFKVIRFTSVTDEHKRIFVVEIGWLDEDQRQ